MKFYALLGGLYLAGLGIGAPAPLTSVQFLAGIVTEGAATGHIGTETSHFGDSDTPLYQSTVEIQKRGPKKTKSKTTKTKSKKPKASKTKAPTTKTKKPKPSKTKSLATKTGHSSKTPTACARKGKKTGKGKRGSETQQDESCEPESDDHYLRLAKGWRSPTKKEQAAAKVKTFLKTGGESPHTFATTAPEYTGPLPDDCPTTYKGYLTAKIEGASGTGILKQPKPNQPLFYTAGPQRGAERDWAHKQGMGFRFLKDHFKTDESVQKWIFEHQNCPDFWGLASAAYASLVEDDVHVLLPSKMFEVGKKPVWPTIKRAGQAERKAIWDSHEYPTILKDNEKACRIWRWIYASSTPELIAVRTGASARTAGCPATYADKPSSGTKGKGRDGSPDGGSKSASGKGDGK